jgi:hypothetical protein
VNNAIVKITEMDGRLVYQTRLSADKQFGMAKIIREENFGGRLPCFDKR